MKEIFKLSAIAMSLLISGGAYAQAKNFEGPIVGLAVSTVGASTNATIAGETVAFGGQSFVPSAEIGYNFAATDKVVLGLTATYDFTKTNAGQITDGYKLEGKNHYSINFKPGYTISDSTLVYATVGYNSMKGSVTNLPETTSFSGIGYGLGAMMMVDKNIYIRLEAQRVDFGSKTNSIDGEAISYKPSATIGTIGVGYKF
jgi:opacity protein-like surface antigen